MNVKEMMDTMRILGIGEVYSDSESKRISLVYLNLAHQELYRETASINDDILVDDQHFTNIIGQSYIDLGQKPFLMSKIYRQGYAPEIEKLSSIKFNSYKRSNLFFGDPIFYSLKGRIINFYPINSGLSYDFNVSFVPKITSLLESTPEDDIPYPAEYHSVLVDMALYYLFHDESGFKNIEKENESKIRAEKGKAALKSYFFGKNTEEIRTFENA